MLKNDLTVALRSLRRQKGYALLNVAGLALGMACCLLIARYVQEEWTYDRFHPRAERIYRATFDLRSADSELHMAVTPPPLAAVIRDEIPEVEHVARLVPGFTEAFVARDTGDTRQVETRFFLADPAVFAVFDLAFIEGVPGTALAAPASVVLTQTTARRYFGDENPVGRRLLVREGNQPETEYQVTGVVRDLPGNAHFHFDFLGSLAGHPAGENTDWFNLRTYTYILLREGAAPAEVDRKLEALARTHAGPSALEGIGQRLDELEAAGGRLRYPLQPLLDIHLRSGLGAEIEPPGSPGNLYAFSAMAVFILLLACVNYVNLATARAGERAREVGVRKAVGAGRGQLVRQFLAEALLHAVLATVLAFAIGLLAMPAFSLLAGREMTLADPDAVPLVLFGVNVGVGILSGLYPAFALTAFQPSAVLKGKGSPGVRGVGMRRVLVAGQFAIAIFLLMGTGVVTRQLAYMRAQDLGFDREHVLVLPRVELLGAQREAFRQALLQHPGIERAAFSNGLPGRRAGRTAVFPEGMDPGQMPPVAMLAVHYGFAETLGLELTAGRTFSPDFASDSTAVVVNETAVRAMKLSEPIGARVHHPGGPAGPVLTIIGVVRDFHLASLREPVEPVFLRLGPRPGEPRQLLAARVRTDDLPGLLAYIEGHWQTLAPAQPFTYSFLDADFDRLYRTDQRTALLVRIFAGLAVLVACLGLFGLAAFTAQRRTKEIGVRKVLGASVAGLVVLFSREIVVLVLAAALVALPAAYVAAQHWLDAFAYRITLTPPVFIGAALLTLAVALLTVGYHAVRAALADPVRSLRYE